MGDVIVHVIILKWYKLLWQFDRMCDGIQNVIILNNPKTSGQDKA